MCRDYIPGSLQGHEIVHAVTKAMDQCKAMVPGSSPGRGGGHSGVFRPASVLNSIKIPDTVWDFDFRSSAPEPTFCLILAYLPQILNQVSVGYSFGSKRFLFLS